MAEETKVYLPKFAGKDFQVWKRQILVVIKSKNLFGALEPEEEHKVTDVQDYLVQAILLNALSTEMVQKVINCKTSADIWKRLLTIYENASPASIDRILEQYYSYRMDESSDVYTH